LTLTLRVVDDPFVCKFIATSSSRVNACWAYVLTFPRYSEIIAEYCEFTQPNSYLTPPPLPAEGQRGFP